MNLTPLTIVGAAGVGIGLSAIASLFVPPLPRLSTRVRRYTRLTASAAISDLGERAEAAAKPTSPLAAVARVVSERLGRLAGFRDADLTLKLRQAGLSHFSPSEFRARIVGKSLLFGLIAIGLFGVGGFPTLGLLVGVLTAFSFAARAKGALENQTQKRNERIRQQLYSVNQILAIHLRTGAGVVQACQRVIAKSTGAVTEELAHVLSNIRNGMSEEEAFEKQFETCSEANARRTFHLFAASSRHGVDLAESLLQLSKDLRDERREELRNKATKRRTAMLVPTIGVLAPIMLLFIGAPIPSIVFGYF